MPLEFPLLESLLGIGFIGGTSGGGLASVGFWGDVELLFEGLLSSEGGVFAPFDPALIDELKFTGPGIGTPL
jgi:hypothetical protein